MNSNIFAFSIFFHKKNRVELGVLYRNFVNFLGFHLLKHLFKRFSLN